PVDRTSLTLYTPSGCHRRAGISRCQCIGRAEPCPRRGSCGCDCTEPQTARHHKESTAMRRNRFLIFLVVTALPLAAATAPAADEPAAVSIEVKDKSAIEFRHGKELSGRYNIAPSVAKPYLWPVNAP